MSPALLEGRVALVTGGSRGIGRAIVSELAARGAAVIVNYHNSPEKAGEVVAEIESAGGRAAAFQADVSNFKDAQGLVKFAVETYGDLHILVNNAGITRDSMFHRMTREQWNEVIGTNLNGLFNMTHPIFPGMRERGFGRIINISSINGQKGQAGQANYSASKAGDIGFTKALAQEGAFKGITVNAICPGYIGTEMVRAVPEKVLNEKILPFIPVGRLGEPEEIARCVVFLASDDAGFITGATISANGGQYMI